MKKDSDKHGNSNLAEVIQAPFNLKGRQEPTQPRATHFEGSRATTQRKPRHPVEQPVGQPSRGMFRFGQPRAEFRRIYPVSVRWHEIHSEAVNPRAFLRRSSEEFGWSRARKVSAALPLGAECSFHILKDFKGLSGKMSRT
jgi:hypothetical protein